MLSALKALTPTHIEMRKPGDWYVSAYARTVRDGNLLRGAYGEGRSPDEAVINDWKEISKAACVRIGGDGAERTVRWNGFMWEDTTP